MILGFIQEFVSKLRQISALADIIGAGNEARIYPVVANVDSEMPCVIYTKKDFESVHTHTGPTGNFSVTYELMCCSHSAMQADQISDIIRDNLDGFSAPLVENAKFGAYIRLTDENSDFEPENEIFTVKSTYTILIYNT